MSKKSHNGKQKLTLIDLWLFIELQVRVKLELEITPRAEIKF